MEKTTVKNVWILEGRGVDFEEYDPRRWRFFFILG